MQIHPYLIFNGQCEEAFKFYARVLNGRILEMLPHAGTPSEQHVSADWRTKILHAKLSVGDGVLMASDDPNEDIKPLKGFYVSLQFGDPAEGERVFQTLAENGSVTMPFQPTFWAQGFGMLVDRFGVPWMINCTQGA